MVRWDSAPWNISWCSCAMNGRIYWAGYPQAYNQPQLPTLSWLAGASYRGEGTPPASVTALARMRLKIITELEQRLNDHARMDFAFLYSEATCLLSVGYNCDTNTADKKPLRSAAL
ncbi:Uncharacterised protein [Raoultella ornithinolytica]|nr:Uncharacterised protein [Raoultella ornithinolytica]